jgi:ATP-dependent Zn protease
MILKRNIVFTAIGAVVLICLLAVPWIRTVGYHSMPMATYSEFLDQINSGRVASVVIIGSNSGAVEATYRLKGREVLRTVLPSDYKDALRAMQERLVDVEIRNASPEPLRMLFNVMPVLLLFSIWMILMILKFPNRLQQGHTR